MLSRYLHDVVFGSLCADKLREQIYLNKMHYKMKISTS